MPIKPLLLTHVFATLFMVGLIWFVQIVHYPLFANVGADQFKRYEELHQKMTTWVVGPAMLVELATAVLLLKGSPSNCTQLLWAGLVLVGIIWLTTAGLSVPAHNSLAEGFNDAAYRKLVSTNWIRTVAWTARGVLVLMIVHRVYAAETLS